jgi:hypothetical protein
VVGEMDVGVGAARLEVGERDMAHLRESVRNTERLWEKDRFTLTGLNFESVGISGDVHRPRFCQGTQVPHDHLRGQICQFSIGPIGPDCGGTRSEGLDRNRYVERTSFTQRKPLSHSFSLA